MRRVEQLRLWCAVALVVTNLSCFVPRGHAQKVTLDPKNPAHLDQYRRYAWGTNFLMTSLHPDDKSRVERTLNASIDRQLHAKGYVLDTSNPDFVVSYGAGGQLQAGAGVKPDMLYSRPTQLYTAQMDIWNDTLAQLKISIADAASKAPLWQVTASEKIKNRDKFLKELERNVDRITANALKEFPRASSTILIPAHL